MDLLGKFCCGGGGGGGGGGSDGGGSNGGGSGCVSASVRFLAFYFFNYHHMIGEKPFAEKPGFSKNCLLNYLYFEIAFSWEMHINLIIFPSPIFFLPPAQEKLHRVTSSNS